MLDTTYRRTSESLKSTKSQVKPYQTSHPIRLSAAADDELAPERPPNCG
jgi:hypothetical protein